MQILKDFVHAVRIHLYCPLNCFIYLFSSICHSSQDKIIIKECIVLQEATVLNDLPEGVELGRFEIQDHTNSKEANDAHQPESIATKARKRRVEVDPSLIIHEKRGAKLLKD